MIDSTIVRADQQADVAPAIPLLTGIRAGRVIADKGYESNKLLALVRDQGAEAVSRPSETERNPGITTGNCISDVT